MAKYRITPSSKAIIQLPISIGHKAEKGVEAIEFDVTAWVETYGSGTLTVIMRRWGDEIPYPIALEIDENNKATWTLSDIDTAKAGMAYAQLSYIVGDEVVKKSDIYTFRVMNSLTGEGEPPEAYESWLEQLTHLAAEAMAEVLDIEGVVTDKTLTVDGGIADAKAAGDALALKADKSTTYTKTEVDQMIEDVEVETDTTLEIAGAPADAAETGRQIGLLKADLPAQRYIKDYPNGCILDKEGNVILRGGVDVKQTSRYVPQYPGGAVFDAEGQLMLVGESQYNPLKGLKVSIIGDSISSYEGWIPTGYARAYPDNDTVDNVNKMWWKRLIDMSGMELCVNAAWSGSRVSGNLLTDQTAKPACSNQRIADLTNPTTGEKPNVVICFIGTNDWSSGIEIGDFDSTSEIPEDGNITEISTAYALMLYKIRTTYPNAHIFCIPPLSRNLLNSSLVTDDSYPILNNNGESIHQISKKIEELALLFGATVINMERMGMSYWNIYKYLRSDTLHPNAAGMEMIAVRCYKVIKDYFRGLEF